MKIQSVIFEKKYWNIKKAIKWLDENDYIHNKVDKTPHYYRFRQLEPTFKKYVTKDLKNGILLILGV